MKKESSNVSKISSTNRLEQLLNEAEDELSTLEPQIEKLEKQLEKLRELKLAKQKLITLKLSIKSILENFSKNKVDLNTTGVTVGQLSQNLGLQHSKIKFSTSQVSAANLQTPKLEKPEGVFVPERAFAEVNAVLRKTTSLNYELFRAIVFNGGQAGTEAIKQYLVDNRITQPASGESFASVELTDISSRVNYLVRKGIVRPDGRGNFISLLGWTEAETLQAT